MIDQFIKMLWTLPLNSLLQVSKNIVLQWGELPTSVAYIGTGQIMGWGNKAIEIRSVESGHLDGVFMHKKAQKLKFLCERNDKVKKVTFLEKFCFLILFIFRCFSPRPRVVRRVKSTSWPSTNPAWQIGRFSNTEEESKQIKWFQFLLVYAPHYPLYTTDIKLTKVFIVATSEWKSDLF